MEKTVYKIGIFILITAININGMEESEPTEYQPAGGRLVDQSSTISCKTYPGVSDTELTLQKNISSSLPSATYSPKDNLPTPRKAVTESLHAVDLIHDNSSNSLYFLGKNQYHQKNIFKKESNTIKDLQKLPVQFLAHQDSYFFYRLTTHKKNKIFVHKKVDFPTPYAITHNKPIIAFGNIQNTVFTGSEWPSIQKTIIPKGQLSSPLKQEPFIENAFLLGCKDNCMVIAKIDEKNNGSFWFWRRFSKEKQNVRVTLYALFFKKKTIQSMTKKDVELLLEKAAENDTAATDNVSIIKIPGNVLLTEQAQTNPAQSFPKVAIANNTALIVHTQHDSDYMHALFDIINPKVSIAYKDKENTFQVNATDLKTLIKRQKDILDKSIRLPYFDEIKNVYLTNINNQDICVLVSQTDDKGSCADGVYLLSLEDLTDTSKKEYIRSKQLASSPAEKAQESQPNVNEKPQPTWHVDIAYQQKNYNETSKKYKNESWNAIEQIVASTFDYNNKNLFLITEQKKDPKKGIPNQKLITINLEQYIKSILNTKK